MHMVNFSEARSNLKAVMDKAVADRAPIGVTRQRGQEGVVIVSQADWDALEETLYLLSTPNNARELLDSIAELDAGKGVERELIHP